MEDIDLGRENLMIEPTNKVNSLEYSSLFYNKQLL